MKAKIVQERPINRNKDDYGQYAFLHHVASSLTGEFVYFCRKRSNVVGKGSWEQEAMPVERFRSMVEHGNCVLTGENVFISTNTFANENGRISQNVHSFNDWERVTQREILMARFTEDDILRGKILSPEGKLRVLVNKALGQPDIH